MKFSKYYHFKYQQWTVYSVGVLIVSLGITFAILHYTTKFLKYNESIPGYMADDPVLNAIPATDHSHLIFCLTYTGIILGLILSFRSMYRIFVALQTIGILLLFRILCMSIIPLEPPPDIIPLQDGLLVNTFYEGRILLKDLFFSGHTASVAVMAFLVNNRKLFYVFIIWSLIVGSLLVIQHVHYSFDVLFAYPFTYLAYIIGSFTGKKSMILVRYINWRTKKLVVA